MRSVPERVHSDSARAVEVGLPRDIRLSYDWKNDFAATASSIVKMIGRSSYSTLTFLAAR